MLNPDGAVVNRARAPEQASRILLPVVPDIDAPLDPPPCPSLRFQYCRPYRPTITKSASE